VSEKVGVLFTGQTSSDGSYDTGYKLILIPWDVISLKASYNEVENTETLTINSFSIEENIDLATEYTPPKPVGKTMEAEVEGECVGEALTITVSDGRGRTLTDARIEISLDGDTLLESESATGILKYIPQTAGDYNLKASRRGYRRTRENFRVVNCVMETTTSTTIKKTTTTSTTTSTSTSSSTTTKTETTSSSSTTTSSTIPSKTLPEKTEKPDITGGVVIAPEPENRNLGWVMILALTLVVSFMIKKWEV